MFGGQYLPNFSGYIRDHLNTDLDHEFNAQEEMQNITPSIINHDFLTELGTENFSRRSFMKAERIMHSHGACLQEVWELRNTRFERFADMILYPRNTEDC